MRKMKFFLKKVKQLAHGYKASKWPSETEI